MIGNLSGLKAVMFLWRFGKLVRDARAIGLITVFDTILMGRQSGQKLQYLYGNLIANNFFQN